MPVVTLSNISKSFGPRQLFSELSMFVGERENVALIGPNGCGKTTLLKMIMGLVECDSGTINLAPGLSAGYLPQDVDLPPAASLLIAVAGITDELLSLATSLNDLEIAIAEGQQLGNEYADLTHRFDTLGGYAMEASAKAILNGLGFIEDELSNPVSALSGGQKTRAALARLLLQSPDFLLLDEPTNHLDISACDWLQDFLLTRYQGAALIVSHDRYFLDQVVTRVLEMDKTNIESYSGNYSTYAAIKAARIEEMQKLYKSQQKEIARLESAIQTLFSHRKFTRRDSKVKELERIQTIAKAGRQRSVKISVTSGIRSGKEVVRLSKLSKAYGEKQLFDNSSYVVERGKKVGVVGPNGSGKSTLLKIITGQETPDAGETILGHNVKMAYFAQDLDHLDNENSVLEELTTDTEMNAKEARDLLAKFLFMGDDAFKRVEMLSGGEKCRLALAKILASEPNLLLLDEPTNHLDIASREALEEALKSYNGTIITASHDRYLLNEITNEILEIKGGHLKHYLGNYSDYHARITAPALPATAVKGTVSQKARPTSALRELERMQRDLSKDQKETEAAIHSTETRLAELTTDLGNEEYYRDGSVKALSAEYDQKSAALQELYARWEDICAKLEELNTTME